MHQEKLTPACPVYVRRSKLGDTRSLSFYFLLERVLGSSLDHCFALSWNEDWNLNVGEAHNIARLM